MKYARESILKSLLYTEKVIDRLSKNNNIIIIKKGKERGVAILDCTKYTDKCLSMLATKQFQN